MKTACLDRNRELIPHRARFLSQGDSGKEVFNAPYVDSATSGPPAVSWPPSKISHNYAIALDTGNSSRPRRPRQVSTPFALPNGTSTGYGLGWHVETDKDGRQWVYHSGGATGGAAFVLRAPADGLAVVLLCNLERPATLKNFRWIWPARFCRRKWSRPRAN